MPSATSGRSRHSSANSRNTQVAPAAPKDKKDNSKVTEEWVEPPLEQLKPSYEDHGGAPYGVLEDMLPLGQAPNAKVKARVRGDAGSKKNQLNKSAAGIASDTQDTPETTPAFDAPSSALDAEPLPSQPLLIFDDERDQDYMPKKAKKTATGRASRSSLARAAASSPANAPADAMSTFALPSDAPLSEDPVEALVTEQSPQLAPESPAPRRTTRQPTNYKADVSEVIAVDSLHSIVEAAVVKSLEKGDALLGAGLRAAYNESLHDPHLMSLFRAIVDTDISPEDASVFRSRISDAKRRARRRGDIATKHQQSPLRTNGAISSASASPPRRDQLPELIPVQSIEAPTAQTRPKVTIRVNPPKKTSIKIQPSKKIKLDKLPKPRSGSISSLTSLSSLTSVENDAMDIESDDDASAQQSAQTDSQSGLSNLPSINGLTVNQPRTFNSLKRSSVEIESDSLDRQLAMKKQKLSEGIDRQDRSQPSFERTERTESSGTVGVNSGSIIPPVTLRARGRPSIANGGQADDVSGSDSDLSPPPPFMPGTPRAGTTKGIKKKAKTKQSPTKVQTASSGANANGSGGRESPIGNDDNEESDNNDFCSSCRGTGYLLCCDGCDRSFHFACVDPPLSQDAKELQEPWFCYKCVAKRAQPQRHQRSLFSGLLSSLDKRNPSIYSLPQDIREYFDGVATGKDGRLLETLLSKTRSRAGYDELPDNFKMRDSKGHTILCVHCNKSSLGRREIITCDTCAAHWHLDCLDPPLANPPHRDGFGKKIRDWLCPRHVDHELREMDLSRVAGRAVERDRKIFMRRPRNAKVVDTSLNRGFVNNGLIEVVNDDSEEEDDFYEEEVSGTVYRLPEKGIKLDFIDKVNQTRQAPQPVRALVAPPSQLSKPDFARRPFIEQRAALQLIQFANRDTGLEISSDEVENLLAVTMAEAPDDAVALIEEEDNKERLAAKKDAEQQRKKLELLQALIAKKIEALAKE